MRFTWILALIIGLAACNSSADKATVKDEETGITYKGEQFEAKEVMNYDDFLSALEGKDSLEAVVRGNVEGVCQVKGCWMNIVSKTEGKEEMFVKFKDYGFFMPLDLTGEVVMKGVGYREITTVDELRHYAEDEGKSKEEIETITEPVVELKFMASGVILEDDKKVK